MPHEITITQDHNITRSVKSHEVRRSQGHMGILSFIMSVYLFVFAVCMFQVANVVDYSKKVVCVSK